MIPRRMSRTASNYCSLSDSPTYLSFQNDMRAKREQMTLGSCPDLCRCSSPNGDNRPGHPRPTLNRTQERLAPCAIREGKNLSALVRRSWKPCPFEPTACRRPSGHNSHGAWPRTVRQKFCGTARAFSRSRRSAPSAVPAGHKIRALPDGVCALRARGANRVASSNATRPIGTFT